MTYTAAIISMMFIVAGYIATKVWEAQTKRERALDEYLTELDEHEQKLSS